MNIFEILRTTTNQIAIFEHLRLELDASNRILVSGQNTSAGAFMTIRGTFGNLTVKDSSPGVMYFGREDFVKWLNVTKNSNTISFGKVLSASKGKTQHALTPTPESVVGSFGDFDTSASSIASFKANELPELTRKCDLLNIPHVFSGSHPPHVCIAGSSLYTYDHYHVHSLRGDNSSEVHFPLEVLKQFARLATSLVCSLTIAERDSGYVFKCINKDKTIQFVYHTAGVVVNPMGVQLAQLQQLTKVSKSASIEVESSSLISALSTLSNSKTESEIVLSKGKAQLTSRENALTTKALFSFDGNVDLHFNAYSHIISGLESVIKSLGLKKVNLTFTDVTEGKPSKIVIATKESFHSWLL